jgi:hypothetical protein
MPSWLNVRRRPYRESQRRVRVVHLTQSHAPAASVLSGALAIAKHIIFTNAVTEYLTVTNAVTNSHADPNPIAVIDAFSVSNVIYKPFADTQHDAVPNPVDYCEHDSNAQLDSDTAAIALRNSLTVPIPIYEPFADAECRRFAVTNFIPLALRDAVANAECFSPAILAPSGSPAFRCSKRYSECSWGWCEYHCCAATGSRPIVAKSLPWRRRERALRDFARR